MRPDHRSAPIHVSAPPANERPPRARVAEVTAYGWDFHVELDAAGAITWTALIWGNPGNPADWRLIPVVLGGELRREIEWALGWGI